MDPNAEKPVAKTDILKTAASKIDFENIDTTQLGAALKILLQEKDLI